MAPKKKKPEKIAYYVVLVASPAVHVIQDCLTAGVKLFVHVASLLPAHVQGVKRIWKSLERCLLRLLLLVPIGDHRCRCLLREVVMHGVQVCPR